MLKKYPFHYEVRFKFLAFDKNNNIRIESHSEIFKDKQPLEIRSNAFDEFAEYLSFLEKAERLEKDQQGNYHIIQPSSISEILDKKKQNYEEYKEFLDVFDQYKEEISVYLVVDDLNIAKNAFGKELKIKDDIDFSKPNSIKLDDIFDYVDSEINEYEIHKVASFSFDRQNIVDNLDMYEIRLYEYFNINIEDLKETVYHYGDDYWMSGEDEEDGAKRIILRTPFVWDSLEKYKESHISNQNNEEIQQNDGFNLEEIIKRGEGNQIEFKPCLHYNFKTKKSGYNIMYIIAKAICAFLNSNGGVLLIGVNDDGNIQGLEYDYSLFDKDNKKDGLLLTLDSLLFQFFGLSVKPLVDSQIEKVCGKDILIIAVSESHKPIFLRHKNYEQIEKEMYIRMNASTHQIIDNEELVEYVLNKQWRNPSN